MPSQSSSRTASRSVMPGRRPNSSFRTPCDVWHAAYSNAASWSTSLIDAQAVGRVDQQAVGVSDGAGRSDEPAQLVDEEGRHLDRSGDA